MCKEQAPIFSFVGKRPPPGHLLEKEREREGGEKRDRKEDIVKDFFHQRERLQGVKIKKIVLAP